MRVIKIIIPFLLMIIVLLGSYLYFTNGFHSKTYYYNKGLAEVKLGNGGDYTIFEYLEKASKHLEIAVSKGITTKEVFYNLAFCYINTNDTINLEKTYNRGLQYYPKEVFFYYYRGHCRTKLKKYKESIADYSKVIELDSNKEFLGNAYYERGVLLYILGRKDEAQNDWNKAQQLTDYELRTYEDYANVIK
jgi:tetratricopeptide (TPR) repeat protein